jgi:NAD(P)-dependent dehydrogenase (short-subunit alcohol dehydrogenase family)
MAMEEEYRRLTPRYPELKGQVAIVTGGAKGIGQGIVLRLVREGMRVVVADIDDESLGQTIDALENLGVNVCAFQGDLSQPAIIGQLFEHTLSMFGGVNLLVNNAANLERRRLLDEHEDLFKLQIETNLSGPYLCSIKAAKIMREAGGGSIIHISSVGGLRAHAKGFPYDVTKGAIDSMTRAMAIDLAEYNIRVNAIAPGAIRTNRTPSSEHPLVREMSARIPLQRFGLVSEISATVVFLASPEASYITGQIVYVDGGITAQLAPPGQIL